MSLAWSYLPPSLTLTGFNVTVGPFPDGPLAGSTYPLDFPPADSTDGISFSWGDRQQSHLETEEGSKGRLTSSSRSNGVSVSADSLGFTLRIILPSLVMTEARWAGTMATSATSASLDPASIRPHKSARALHWASPATQEVPHVTECNYCYKCLVDNNGSPEPDEAGVYEDRDTGRRLLGDLEKAILEIETSAGVADTLPSGLVQGHYKPYPNGMRYLKTTEGGYVRTGGGLQASSLRPEKQVLKYTLPNCTVCRGCNTELSPVTANTAYFNRTFTHGSGASPGWVLRATTDRTASGSAVVKVYCMPLPKVPGSHERICDPQAILKKLKLLLGIERLSEECGFHDISPKLWVDRIDAVIPGLGFHVHWHGLWMEAAEGIDFESLVHKGEPTKIPRSVVLDLLHNKLNGTQVIRGAIFDLLTSQCDRHAQNIFVDERGQLKLIDNEMALQSLWRDCGVDSILVPTTQKYNIVRMGMAFIRKEIYAAAAPQGNADPQVLLDYRCHVPEGQEAIGIDYPPQIKQCLTKIAGMSVSEVLEHYGFTEELVARNLKTRATDMIELGFEHAYMYGEPRNANSKRYRMMPKCCRLKRERYDMTSCEHDWPVKFELPLGDPLTGRVAWTRGVISDTGTYEGGTFEILQGP